MTESGGLTLYWETHLIGQLSINQKRQFQFQYDAKWLVHPEAKPLSQKLPLQPGPFEHDIARPFFANLLPESEIRKLITQKVGISEKNDFGLLAAIGGECAGAISLLPSNTVPDFSGKYKLITPKALDEMIDQMPRRPLLAHQEGMRLSLAGAQNKLPIYIDDAQHFFLPEGFNSSSHILKPPIPQLTETVENEAFCMLLAKSINLPVPEVTLHRGHHQSYIVKRYDRYKDADQKLRRLHQEDFCQALGFYPDQKYEVEGGPKFKDCFAILKDQSVLALSDKLKLILWAIFNTLIGNCDAHAKNISLLTSKNGLILAPFYDLMSTAVYPDLNSKMAMKIGNQYERERVVLRNWKRFAQDAEIADKLIVSLVKEMSEELPKNAKQLASEFVPQYGGAKIISKICAEIDESCRRTLYFIAAPDTPEEP